MKTLTDYKEYFQKNQYVIIDDFLPEDDADTLYDYFYSKTSLWWDNCIFPDQDIEFPAYQLGLYKDDDSQLLSKREWLKNELDKHELFFTYRYKRKGFFEHHLNEPWHSKDDTHSLLYQFNENSLKQSLSYITGYDDLNLQTLFCSCYEDGDYNAIHKDSDDGRRLAYVYHLTKEWQFMYGGLYMSYNPEQTQVKDVLIPRFNKMAIFDVSGDKTPHSVTQVANGVTNKRYALTGWYE
jgi:Rps23 Pro-64 3,4-dihydroxylase Tpa1-like proline 4-hydroxylase